jgi:hypothetical protein
MIAVPGGIVLRVRNFLMKKRIRRETVPRRTFLNSCHAMIISLATAIKRTSKTILGWCFMSIMTSSTTITNMRSGEMSSFRLSVDCLRCPESITSSKWKILGEATRNSKNRTTDMAKRVAVITRRKISEA